MYGNENCFFNTFQLWLRVSEFGLSRHMSVCLSTLYEQIYLLCYFFISGSNIYPY